MDISLGITLGRVIAKVIVPENRADNILAFGSLEIYQENPTTNDPFILVKGFTIRKKIFNGKDVVDVTFPAYRAGQKFVTSFVLAEKDVYISVKKLLLDSYYQQAGDAAFYETKDEVNIDDIPDDLGEKH